MAEQDALHPLDEELRLIAEETGIALERDMPIVGFVRAAATTATRVRNGYSPA